MSYSKKVKPLLNEIKEWRKDGYNLTQISERLGVTRKTLNIYMAKYEELREIMILGKKEYEVDLRKSLYARAKGFMVKETTTRSYYNADGDLIKKVVNESERYVYSDFMASKLLRLDTVLDNDDIPLELQEIMKITENNIDDEYADE